MPNFAPAVVPGGRRSYSAHIGAVRLRSLPPAAVTRLLRCRFRRARAHLEGQKHRSMRTRQQSKPQPARKIKK